ncbi:MAG: hypothetical protein AVDCRST_MAG45-681 [uncultured Solirubrobacterales bacterium]|uniref:Uncharacterized protein n=1 Tax=uncultured Solirubrobacterales bacterium TaxID=768556 RepID=A0A6J4S658_9ACTN|nr:MAG: hypothetical protein AVDCRST_MAG45-681 [uncultured Solirubrobacterales bacterium]
MGLPVIPDAIADAPSDPLIWLLVLVILFTLMLGLGCLLAAVLVWRLTNAGRVMGLVGAPIAIALTVALVIGGFSMADPEVGRVALAILIGVGLPPLIFWLLWKERQAFR